MRNLDSLKGTLAENVLTMAASAQIKGGTGDSSDYEKRRERPGGGINTNRPTNNGNKGE
jgi:hypothetical protein